LGGSSQKQILTPALWRIATPVGAGAIHFIRFGDTGSSAENDPLRMRTDAASAKLENRMTAKSACQTSDTRTANDCKPKHQTVSRDTLEDLFEGINNRLEGGARFNLA
jgi:hypothetical protein